MDPFKPLPANYFPYIISALWLYLRDMKRANRGFAQPLDGPQADA